MLAKVITMPGRRRLRVITSRTPFRRDRAASKIQRMFRGRKRRNFRSRVANLERKVALNRQWGTYELDAGNTTLVNGKWHIRSLMVPSNWTQQFQASNELDSNQKISLYSCNIQLFHRPTDSLIPLTAKFVTVYLVKLKRETAIQTLEATGFMSTPTDTTEGFNSEDNKGRLWETQPIGLTYECFPSLNRDCFQVIRKRQFKIQNIIQLTAATSATVEAAPDVAVTTPPFTFKQSNMYMKAYNTIQSGRGDKSWKEMTEDDLQPTDRYYLLTYVGGSGSELTLEDGNTVDQGIRCTWKVRGTQ